MSPGKTEAQAEAHALEPWAVQPVGANAPAKGSTRSAFDIIDIRRETVGISIVDEIRKGLTKPSGGEKRLPTLLLYDEAGLKLFEKITYLDEYYLTNAEIEVLEKNADQIAERIRPGMLVELGSGNLRKVNILLQALERAQKKVDYYALDLDRKELERTIAAVPQDYRYVKVKGLHGTYDDGAEWLKSKSGVPKCILSLGSSIGNFDRHDAAEFVKQFADILNPNDSVLIGLDGCKQPERVYHAYNDRHGVTHSFILNGLKHANQLLETEVFDLSKWRAIGEFDEENGRHQAFVSPVEDTLIEGILVKRDERVRIEESHKFSLNEVVRLFEHASLAPGATWTNGRGDHGLHMASKPVVSFPVKASQYASRPVPTLSEWEELWKTWDLVTQQMIPEAELLTKPIKLRNVCLFYLGHIPTFLDIQLVKQTGGAFVDAEYPKIFERGIDPDVDNPEQCHNHSEIPDEWPPKSEILAFQDKLRNKVRDFYKTNEAYDDRKIARAMWIGFEHEAMHLETLLYMLVQSEKMLPPDGVIRPDFTALAQQAKIHSVANEWFTIPERDLKLGLEDPENDDGPDRYFGWDNEKPPRKAHVNSFQAKARPITNGEYAEYLVENHISTLPASWVVSERAQDEAVNGHTNGENGQRTNGYTNGTMNGNVTTSPSESLFEGKAFRTVFGKVPLKLAATWPLVASYDELAGCAKWMGGRIPTADEAHSIYEYSDELKRKASIKSSANIPAVNGHLVNDGVEETPPNGNGVKPPSPYEHFFDLHEANVGFKHWHPIPVAPNGNKLGGQGDMGGAWEWTSTVLDKHEGFEPMKLYPVYTADFFDGKHNVMLGGSWATHPRIAGRKTFVNWYQRNYLYAWAGARVVRDQ